MFNLYEECVKAGVKIEHHESDLYVPVNETTRKLVEENVKNGGVQHKTFQSNIAAQPPHGLWYDIPFAYLPYWQEKEKENDRRRALEAKDTH